MLHTKDILSLLYFVMTYIHAFVCIYHTFYKYIIGIVFAVNKHYVKTTAVQRTRLKADLQQT
jgi:hypothetical protein